MGQKEIDFDSTKFDYVGSVARGRNRLRLCQASGIDNVEKWLASKVAPRMGATAPGTGGHDVSRILNATLALPIQLVLGYKSTGDMRVAVERGSSMGFVQAGRVSNRYGSSSLRAAI